MKMTFPGGFETLQSVVMLTGIAGEWRCGENHFQYRANTGAVFNWWKSTGTVTFQGPEAAAMALRAAFLKVASVHGTVSYARKLVTA